MANISRKDNGKLLSPVEQLEGGGDLGVGEAVEGKVGVLRDRVRVVNACAVMTSQKQNLNKPFIFLPYSCSVFTLSLTKTLVHITVYPLGHQDRLLLATHSLNVVSHDVVQPGQHAQALHIHDSQLNQNKKFSLTNIKKVIFYLCNLGVHGAINIVQQVESFRYQLIPIL